MKGNLLVNKVWKKHYKDKWLQLLRSGDHKAFAEFIDKYKETVFLCCRTLGLRKDEVEDVASETFLAAYKGLSRYTGRAQLSTWLWSIAYRQGVNYLRKNRKQQQFKSELNEQIADSKQQLPPEVMQSKETEQLVWEAVNRLPRIWALTVILYYREGKSTADIAKVMQARENTIKTYLFRARQKLKQLLAVTFGEDADADR